MGRVDILLVTLIIKYAVDIFYYFASKLSAIYVTFLELVLITVLNAQQNSHIQLSVTLFLV